MIRYIAALAVVLVLLVFARGSLVESYLAENPRHTKVASLVDTEKVSVDTVKVLGILVPNSGLELKYYLMNDAWRMPLYRGAYAQSDRIEGIIRDIVASSAIPADTRGREDSFYGLSDDSIVINIYGEGEELFASVQCGRQLPGLWNNDSYVRPVGKEVVYHINGNPLNKLGAPSGLPPLVDPKIIPTALGTRGEITNIRFDPPGSFEIQELVRRERIMSEEEIMQLPPQLRDMPMYDWFAVPSTPSPSEVSSGEAIPENMQLEEQPVAREQKLNERTAGSYVNFVSRMSFTRIPKADELNPSSLTPADRRIVLVFQPRKQPPARGEENVNESEDPSEPIEEFIEVRSLDTKGNRYIYFTGTELIALVPDEKSRLLYPPLNLLMSEQPSPTIFEQAEMSNAPGPFSAQ